MLQKKFSSQFFFSKYLPHRGLLYWVNSPYKHHFLCIRRFGYSVGDQHFSQKDPLDGRSRRHGRQRGQGRRGRAHTGVCPHHNYLLLLDLLLSRLLCSWWKAPRFLSCACATTGTTPRSGTWPTTASTCGSRSLASSRSRPPWCPSASRKRSRLLRTLSQTSLSVATRTSGRSFTNSQCSRPDQVRFLEITSTLIECLSCHEWR